MQTKIHTQEQTRRKYIYCTLGLGYGISLTFQKFSEGIQKLTAEKSAVLKKLYDMKR